jgi:hypothetical protein
MGTYNYEDLFNREEKIQQTYSRDTADKVIEIMDRIPKVAEELLKFKDQIIQGAIQKAQRTQQQKGGLLNMRNLFSAKALTKKYLEDRSRLYTYLILIIEKLKSNFGDITIREITNDKGEVKEVIKMSHAIDILINHLTAPQNKQMVIGKIDRELRVFDL